MATRHQPDVRPRPPLADQSERWPLPEGEEPVQLRLTLDLALTVPEGRPDAAPADISIQVPEGNPAPTVTLPLPLLPREWSFNSLGWERKTSCVLIDDLRPSMYTLNRG